jgi:protein-disulfide isomerase
MRSDLIDTIKFKRNYDVFKYIYSSLPDINESYKNVSWLNIQESTSKLEILVIISVHCKYCKDFVKILVDLLNKYPNQLNVKLGFHCDINQENKINLYYQILHLYYNHQDRLKILELYEKNKWNLTNHFLEIDIYNYQQILNEQYQWNKMNYINYTPTIILNSKVIPSKYDFDDIKYFLQEAIIDPDFIK